MFTPCLGKKHVKHTGEWRWRRGIYIANVSSTTDYAYYSFLVTNGLSCFLKKRKLKKKIYIYIYFLSQEAVNDVLQTAHVSR